MYMYMYTMPSHYELDTGGMSHPWLWLVIARTGGYVGTYCGPPWGVFLEIFVCVDPPVAACFDPPVASNLSHPLLSNASPLMSHSQRVWANRWVHGVGPIWDTGRSRQCPPPLVLASSQDRWGETWWVHNMKA